MRGKGGPENASCKYRGVRQRTWGKWVSEISLPNYGDRIWIGTFDDSKAAALAYDEAAIRIYGVTAKLNFPEMSLQVHSTASTSAGSTIDQNAVVDQSPYGDNLDIPNFIEKLLEMQQGENPLGDEVALIANPYACLVNDHVYNYHDQILLQEGQRAVAPTSNHVTFEGSDVTKDDKYQKAKNDDNKERMRAELPENDASPDEGIETTCFCKIKDLGSNIADVSEHVGNDNWEEDLGSINIWF